MWQKQFVCCFLKDIGLIKTQDIFISGERVQVVPEFKYPGVHLDSYTVKKY